MNETLLKKLLEFETKYNAKVVYVTMYGSKLYGTDNEFSDTDYKGVFIPNMDSVLLKKDLEHWTSNTNNKNEKNGVDDIDLQLFSLHKFFELLRKGETGALDLLFSMWSKHAPVLQEPVFIDHMEMYYKKFLNKRLHSFTGYAVGQAKKYGVKGTRYKELSQFNTWFGDVYGERGEKLGTTFDTVKEFCEKSNFKYISVVPAPGPKTGKGDNIIDYLEILGKKFSGDVTIDYFYKRSVDLELQFGNRTKASVEGVDWKALSHSVRVLLEVEELLTYQNIQFPLTEREFVKTVKEGKMDLDEVMDFINKKLDEVKKQLDENTTLPEESDREAMDDLELFFLHLYNKEEEC
jgi:hypothetical protein